VTQKEVGRHPKWPPPQAMRLHREGSSIGGGKNCNAKIRLLIILEDDVKRTVFNLFKLPRSERIQQD